MFNHENKKGDFLIAVVDPRRNGGDDEAVAMVTKVDDEGRVNLRVFLDTGEDYRMPNVEVQKKRPDGPITESQRVAFRSS